MLAFLSRFWLDAKNSDLSDEVKQKEAQILASASFEESFRNTQKKLTIFSDATATQGVISTYLGAIPRAMPSDIFLVSSSINPGGATITGLALSEQSIAQFMVNLEALEVFNTVELTRVDTNSDNQSLIAFTISLTSGGGNNALSLSK
jgi:Tfp pilus assembly protein PilN